jgi:hypothetical protein
MYRFNWLIDLIDYLLFYVKLKNFSLIWRRHHCRWRAKNLGLCSALRAFEQGGIFIVPHLLWHGTSVFLVSSEWASIYSNPDPHGMYRKENAQYSVLNSFLPKGRFLSVEVYFYFSFTNYLTININKAFNSYLKTFVKNHVKTSKYRLHYVMTLRSNMTFNVKARLIYIIFKTGYRENYSNIGNKKYSQWKSEVCRYTQQ